MIRVKTDAAVNGNPGKVGIGIEILYQKQQFLFKENSELLMDNHLSCVNHSSRKRMGSRNDFFECRFEVCNYGD